MKIGNFNGIFTCPWSFLSQWTRRTIVTMAKNVQGGGINYTTPCKEAEPPKKVKRTPNSSSNSCVDGVNMLVSRQIFFRLVNHKNNTNHHKNNTNHHKNNNNNNNNNNNTMIIIFSIHDSHRWSLVSCDLSQPSPLSQLFFWRLQLCGESCKHPHHLE